MRSRSLFVVLIFLILPVLARTLWFYQGVYQREEKVATPDYLSLKMPLPNLATPAPKTTPIASMVGIAQQPLILFDYAHANSFTLSEIDRLVHELSSRGAQVDLSSESDSLDYLLRRAAAYVVLTPTVAFTPGEIQAVSRFVQRGGRFLVITDPTRNYGYANFELDEFFQTSPTSSNLSSVDIVNQLLSTFGIAFVDDYLYDMTENEGNFRNIVLSNFVEDVVTKGLTKVVFYSAHSIQSSQKTLLEGNPSTLSSKTDQGGDVVVAASASEGNVLAIGDLTFMIAPYYLVQDNSRLIGNIAHFLVSANKQHDLLNFPFLFSKPVDIVVGENIDMDSETISKLTDLQQHFERLGLKVGFAEKEQQDHDLIILDTYPPQKDYQQFIDPFELRFVTDELEETVSGSSDGRGASSAGNGVDGGEKPNKVIIPGFGKLKTSDVSLLLFLPSSDQNVAVVLAKDSKAVYEVIDQITSGLSNCILEQGKLAICPATGSEDEDIFSDYEDSGYDWDSWEEEYDLESQTETPLPTALPYPTPLPSP
ncbi:MAG: hypothetical protein HPY45_06190 [Anaerolineae bacterium]|nr:hypothetical protein [Anaerolineae bacterium]